MNTSKVELPAALSAGKQNPEKRRSFTALWEAFRIAVDSIWSHKLRSVLTLLGIIIGVASVVVVGGAIEGLGSYVSERLVSVFGSNVFIVGRIERVDLTEEEWEKLNKRKRLHLEDMLAVEKNCEGCAAISPDLSWRDDTKRKNRVFYDASISGVSADLPKIQELELSSGRFISNFDVFHGYPSAVIGSDIRDELFGPTDPLGKVIKIGPDNFTVVGVEVKNGSLLGQSMDNNIYIPYTAFLKKYGSRQSIEFRVKSPSAEALYPTQDEVRQIMRVRHKLKPNHDDDFDILASQDLQQAIDQIIGIITMVVTPITCISLIVGGIVVMNIMLVSVTERTVEIGMRKAVGAKRSDILLQFLVESVILAATGGAIGLLVAYGLSLIVESATPLPMHITIFYILMSVLVSGGIGLISGIYPAHRASKLSPIVALSRE